MMGLALLIDVVVLSMHIYHLIRPTVGFSGILAKTVVAPIERIKLLLQTQKVNSRIELTKNYKGARACIQEIIQKEGVMALWRGNTANVIRYFPNQAFNFALKDKIRRFLGISTIPNGETQKNGQQKMVIFWNNFIAGSAAGVTTSFVTYPLDMARTRLATDVTVSVLSKVGVTGVEAVGQRQFRGVWDCVRQSYLEGGVARVYRGFPVSVCGGKRLKKR
jgi:solute carrier family 25 (adenine nucleotide translocator) protein 4/5/6/31